MTKDKIKFTFDDWLNGNIDNQDVSRLKIQYVLNEDQGQEKPFISPKEQRKINNAIKQAFNDAVELSVQYRYNDLMNSYNSSPYAENLLKEEIEKLEKRFNNRDEHTKKKVLSGKHSIVGIDSAKYKKVMKLKSEGEPLIIGFSQWNDDENKWVKNDVHDATVEWKLLQELEKMTNDHATSQKKPKPIPDWDKILDRMQELVDEGYSDNQAADMVEKEFDKIRAAKTIKTHFKGYYY